LLLPSGAQGYINAGFRNDQDQQEARRLGLSPESYYAQGRGRGSPAPRGIYPVPTPPVIVDTLSLDRAIRNDPRDAVPRYQRGVKYAQADQWNIAEKDLEAAIRLDPKLGRAYYWRAQVRWRAARWEEALADFDRAVELDANYAPAYVRAALAYTTCTPEKRRNRDKAIQLAERACGLTNHEEPICLRVMATVHAWHGDFDEAVKWQTKVLELFPAEDRQRQYLDQDRLEDLKQGRKVSTYIRDIESIAKRPGSR
jgi:tetratricopeptide (TPR) repeat protein